MLAALQDSLAWVNAHPHWALLLLFTFALLDALFVVGVFVPAGLALFAAGALVAFGSLELHVAAAVATCGAVCGDSLSFWLGRHYGERLFSSAALRRYPEMVHNGRRFFARHGALSVAMARFLGPLRAIVPALAGAAGVRVATFVGADLASAVLWSFSFILPGVAFGASLGLAAEVAGRLALLLFALAAALALAIWLTTVVGRAMQRRAEAWIGGLLDWSRRHRRLGLFGAALADPAQPETPVLALLGTLLFIVSGVWLWLWAGTGLHQYPSTLDAAIFQWLRDLHTPWGLALGNRLLLLGEWPVYAPVALVVFVGLAAQRKRRAAAHWLAALAFGALLSAGLHAIPTVAPPHAFFGTPTPTGHFERDLVLSTIVYAFLPILLSTGAPAPVRRLLIAGSIIVLLLTTLGRLYTGAQWASVTLFSIVVGVVWAALLGLGYWRHRPERLPAARLLPPVLIAFALGTALAWSSFGTPQASAAPKRTVSGDDWATHRWRELPHSRIDVAGRGRQALNLQWAGELPRIASALTAHGWTPPPPLSTSSVLRWLAAASTIAELPILPQVHAGQHPALSLRRIRDDEHAELLRLWPSELHLDDGRAVWVGAVSALAARQRYRLLRYPVATATALSPAQVFADIDGLRMQPREDIWLLSFTDDGAHAAP
ncbi:VTT domain-containing protein [Sinimarinibacterium thermocellulolyticum]|uniref:VTT domain-containing protein n=1 Tax=Sinimarinibacterium thermocellulolyticum TaxID=3170016 RepID=A0ABV2ACE6_9GAMM